MRTLKIDLSILVLILICSTTAVFGQQVDKEKEVKKVVIITKTVDENGVSKTEKIITRGDEKDVFIIDSEHGEEHQIIEVEVDDTTIEKRIKIEIEKGEGLEEEILEWDGAGEIPESIQQALQDRGIELELDGDLNVFHMNDKEYTSNNACLGVMIGQQERVENINGEETRTSEGSSDLGVPILEIIEGSGAEDAGLLKKDIITQINGNVVSTMEDVLTALAPLEGGVTIEVTYLRNGQSAQTNATLKTCGNVVVEEAEEEIEIEGDAEIEGLTIIKNKNKNKVERKIIIKKRKKIETDKELEEIVEQPLDALTRTLALEEIDIFPNPTDGMLTIQFAAPALPTMIKIVDLNGREIYQEELNTFDGKYNKTIDLSKAPEGALILSIRQDDKVFSERLILQR